MLSMRKGTKAAEPRKKKGKKAKKEEGKSYLQLTSLRHKPSPEESLLPDPDEPVKKKKGGNNEP